MELELDDIWNLLRSTTINIFQYEGDDLFDVAYDIIETDSYIAGIVSSIRAKATLDDLALRTLKKPFLVRDYHWVFEHQQIDLRPYPEVLELATILEKARRLCLARTQRGH